MPAANNYCEKLVKSLTDQGKTGNAYVSRASLDSFKDFSNRRKYLISEVDFQTVNNYKEYLHEKVYRSKKKKVEKKLSTNTIPTRYKAPSKSAAQEFLKMKSVTKSLYYVINEIQEGNWSKDIDGIYKE